MDPLNCNEVLYIEVFDEKNYFLIGPHSRIILVVNENGYYVITPFILLAHNRNSLQAPIIVNRARADEQSSCVANKKVEEDQVPTLKSTKLFQLYIKLINDNVEPNNTYTIPKDTKTLSQSAFVTFMAYKMQHSMKTRRYNLLFK
uniref:Uncharacterized protein n=1 Tax=Solanum lycopersicum TaxID=4081 RepID=A0A3Q7I0D5_SOLLC